VCGRELNCQHASRSVSNPLARRRRSPYWRPSRLIAVRCGPVGVARTDSRIGAATTSIADATPPCPTSARLACRLRQITASKRCALRVDCDNSSPKYTVRRTCRIAQFACARELHIFLGGRGSVPYSSSCGRRALLNLAIATGIPRGSATFTAISESMKPPELCDDDVHIFSLILSAALRNKLACKCSSQATCAAFFLR